MTPGGEGPEAQLKGDDFSTEYCCGSIGLRLMGETPNELVNRRKIQNTLKYNIPAAAAAAAMAPAMKNSKHTCQPSAIHTFVFRSSSRTNESTGTTNPWPVSCVSVTGWALLFSVAVYFRFRLECLRSGCSCLPISFVSSSVLLSFSVREGCAVWTACRSGCV